MDCPLYVDCVVNEIEKRKQSHSNSKVDFSTKAKIYNAPCHVMYFCALILRTWDKKGKTDDNRNKEKWIQPNEKSTYTWVIIICLLCANLFNLFNLMIEL